MADNKGWILLTTHSLLFAIISFLLTQLRSKYTGLEFPLMVVAFISLTTAFLTASTMVISPHYATSRGKFVEPLPFYRESSNFPLTRSYLNGIHFQEETPSDYEKTSTYDQMIFFAAKQVIQLDGVVTTKFYYIKISLLLTYMAFFSGIGVIIELFSLQILFASLDVFLFLIIINNQHLPC